MKGYSINIEAKTLQNENYREVLFTGPNSQLVVMSLAPGDEIGEETHAEHDQFIRVEKGEGRAVLNGQEIPLSDGIAIVIPAGTRHNVLNTSMTEPLKLYTVYAPPEHAEGTVQKTKEDAAG